MCKPPSMVPAHVARPCSYSSPSCFVRTCSVVFHFCGGMVAFGSEAVALVISVACCIFVVVTLESSVAPLPRALMRCDVKRSVHRASCFAVTLVGPVN